MAEEKKPEAAAAPAEAAPAAGGGLKSFLPLILAIVLMPALAFGMTKFVIVPQLKSSLGIKASAGALAAPTAPGSDGLGLLETGALEMSNVDLAKELTTLITTQRAYEANGKVITTSDEILNTLVNLKR